MAIPAGGSFKHLWEKKMAFSYCFLAAKACICQRSLSWARGCLQMFLGCFPQGLDRGWERHRPCVRPPVSAWRPPAVSVQPSVWVSSALLWLPWLTGSSRLAACSARSNFSLVSSHRQSFCHSLRLSWAGASEKMVALFLTPASCPFWYDTRRQVLHPSVPMCPWRSARSPLAALLPGFVAGESCNTAP